MDKYIFDESNGLWYELQGDYYIPCLILSEKETQPIGLWGQRHKQYLKVQKQAKAIKKIQEITLPNLRQQLAETTGIFKGKERKALEKQIQQTESELKEKLDKLPDILKDDGYPDVQAFMKTYRKAEAIITQYNQDLAEWEQTVKNGQKPAEKQHRPPERQSVRNRLRQLQEESKQSSTSTQRREKNAKRSLPR